MTKWRRRILWGLAAALVIVLLVAAWFYHRATSYPDYWAPLRPDEPMVLRADALERSVSSRVTLVRPDDATWPLELTATQMNEWLASRLPQWLANQGAAGEVGGAMVVLRDGELELAIETNLSGRPWLLRLLCEPREPESPDGPMRLAVREVYLGELSVKFATAASLVGPQLDDEGRRALADLGDGMPMVMDLGDGRIVTVVDAEVDTDRALLECRTKFVGRPR